jgi:hypothetical protein
LNECWERGAELGEQATSRLKGGCEDLVVAGGIGGEERQNGGGGFGDRRRTVREAKLGKHGARSHQFTQVMVEGLDDPTGQNARSLTDHFHGHAAE